MLIKTIVLAAYALMIVGIGILGMRRTRSFADFFLGGRAVGPWMTAFTYAAAYFSAVLFIGFAGKIGWGFGYSGLWIAVGNALVGVLGVWWLLGNRVRRVSVEYDAHTMPEFLEKRYGSRAFKLFAAVCIFVFFIPYSAAVFMGLSYLFQSHFGMSFPVALLVMGAFTAFYMVLGGYKSMAMIDVVFGMIMVVGVGILLGYTLHAGGGLGGITAGLATHDPRLTGWVGPGGAWPLFCLVFLTSVAPFGMPQLVQKFYAIKSARAIRIGMVASTVLALFICGTAYFCGATTRLFLSPEVTPAAFEAGQPVFDRLMPELLANVVPESLSVLILLLILSASMSTLAALVLISSATVVKDFYAGFVRRDPSDRTLTLLMRCGSVLFVVVSVLLAARRFETIVAILGISWGAIGSVFLGPFLWGLFTRWANTVGAVGSAFVGLGTCIVLYARGHQSPEAGTLGMIVSLVSAPVFSAVAQLFKRTEAHPRARA
ncbi:MAG TPA: sodium:solute symporter family protein [Phycisphaerae bacterium]|nr:sodium:solute symporter family protein [Phycisphaerae bacterium]HNU43736.1 sodium:solute symporter family protein [Phycisphaerae bacterium]